jgi:plasmid stability protein
VTLWYVSAVKNITVSVPDELYRAARMRAAESGTSISALVGDYLRSIAERADEFARLEAQQRRIQGEIERFRARDRVRRDEVHERTVR